MYQTSLPVYNYEVVKILTSDGSLVRKWKEFFMELGLREGWLMEFEKRFKSFEPVEDIWMEILEKWSIENENQNTQPLSSKVVSTLKESGWIKIAEELQGALSIAWNSDLNLKYDICGPELICTQILIANSNQTGCKYETIFSQFIKNTKEHPEITHVTIQDPWLQSANQLNNLTHFLEFLQQNCGSTLKKISLIVRLDRRKDRIGLRKFQMEFLAKIVLEWKSEYGIDVVLSFDNSIENSLISLDNGWSLSSNQGLDIYYLVDSNSEAWSNLELRRTKPLVINCYKEKRRMSAFEKMHYENEMKNRIPLVELDIPTTT